LMRVDRENGAADPRTRGPRQRGERQKHEE
jgi:hypothetical protein